MTIEVTDTQTGQALTVTAVQAALDADTPLLAALQAERQQAGKPVTTWDEFDAGVDQLRQDVAVGLAMARDVLEPDVQPTPVKWAELPAEPVEQPLITIEQYMAFDQPGHLPGDGNPVLAQAVRERSGWTPNPDDYGPRPALDGPRSRLGKRIDGWLQRGEAWLRERFTPVKEEQ